MGFNAHSLRLCTATNYFYKPQERFDYIYTFRIEYIILVNILNLLTPHLLDIYSCIDYGSSPKI